MCGKDIPLARRISNAVARTAEAVRAKLGNDKSYTELYNIKKQWEQGIEEAIGIGNVDGLGEVRYEASIYDYTKSFAQQIDDRKKGLIPKNDSLLVGATPEIFKKIGFNPIPFTINQKHIDYAINGTKDIDHSLGKALLAQLPQALENPVAIIGSQTQPNRVVAVLKIQHNRKKVVAPVEIDGYGTQNNVSIDSNAITSVYGRGNAITKLLPGALNDEAKGNISVFYWNKKEALSLLQTPGLQLPNHLPQDGFVHSITENGSPVKLRIKNSTESQQFKRWFDKSKVVNTDGTPKIVYHGTNEKFWVFDLNKSGKNFGDTSEGFFFFTRKKDIKRIPYIAENYDKVFYKTNSQEKGGIVYVKVTPNNTVHYVEAITTEYHNEKLLVNKQMVKVGLNDIPNLYGLVDAINKKQSIAQYLADLEKIRKAYVRDVKEQYSINKLSQSDTVVKTSNKFSFADAKTKYGRNILYALSNTKKVDDGDVFSASNEEELAHNDQLSAKIVSQNDAVVKTSNKFSFADEPPAGYKNQADMYDAYVPDYKNHHFAKDGFNYRTAYFEDFDGRYYKLTLSVGKKGKINSVYNVGEIKEAQFPLNGSKAGYKKYRGKKASKYSITDNSKNVNPDNERYSFDDEPPAGYKNQADMYDPYVPDEALDEAWEYDEEYAHEQEEFDTAVRRNRQPELDYKNCELLKSLKDTHDTMDVFK